ncbi:MAG: nuclease superfamily [Firmicutes bacterium]|nr:nuclease superfamily [Bacillota bacterium]
MLLVQLVHRMLGSGYLESVYEEALFYELKITGLKIGLLINFNTVYLRGGVKRVMK